MLTLYCPSRGRPDQARELLDSFERTATTDDVEITFLVDSDDPTRSQYPNLYTQIGAPTGDPTGPLNAAVKKSTSDIVGFCGDDSRFETHGWDARVLESLKTLGFSWGDDGHEKPWPSTCFISREITDALGWMVPPVLKRGYFDVVWVNLARLTGTERILPDVIFRHDNSAGDPKSPNFNIDAMVPPPVIESDHLAFDHWLNHEMKKDASKIRHALYK